MARLQKIQNLALDAERRINREFGDLIKLVHSGNQIGAEYLHSILQSQLQTFTYLCRTSPELFKSIASNKTKWPGFISHEANIALENEEMVRKLKLGETAKAAKKNPPESNGDQ